MPRSLTAPLLAIALLCGCATAPPSMEQPIVDGASIARTVVPCKTRIDDLLPRLGSPSRDGRLGRARVMTWIVEWDPLVRYLGVLVDDDGVVADVVWDLPSEIAWAPVDRCAR